MPSIDEDQQGPRAVRRARAGPTVVRRTVQSLELLAAGGAPVSGVDVRAQILDVASDLVAEQGLAATTIDQIAEQVELPEATCLGYFATESALADALVGRVADRWNDLVERVCAADAPVADTVRTLCQLTVELTHRTPRLSRDVVVATFREPSYTRRGVVRMWGFLRDGLTVGQARGEVRIEQDPAILADCVVGLYVSALLFWTTQTDDSISERLGDAADLATELISRAHAV